jgi:DNA-binding NarL/FixJ family response regulator
MTCGPVSAGSYHALHLESHMQKDQTTIPRPLVSEPEKYAVRLAAQGLAPGEIAKRLGIPESAVRALIEAESKKAKTGNPPRK